MPPVYSASAHLFPPVGVLQFLSMGSYDAGITPHCVSDTTDVLLPSHHHLRADFKGKAVLSATPVCGQAATACMG